VAQDLFGNGAPVQEKKKTVPSKRIDLGAAANWSAPAVAQQQAQQAPTVAPASNDLFSLDSAPAQPVPTAAPTSSGGSFWDTPTQQPAQAATQQFDAFADFNQTQTTQPQTPVQQNIPAQQPDLFGSLSSTPVQTPMQQPSFDLMTPMGQSNNIPTMPAMQSQTPQQARNVGSTWGANTGSVNIDLTNLGRPQQQKKSMSMNELKAQTPQSNQAQQQQPSLMSPTMGFNNMDSLL